MKNFKIFLPVIVFVFSLSQNLFAQGVSIDENGLPPDSSAVLDVRSTVKGLLIPRMTTAQRDAIDLTGNPNSVLIFNTTTQCYEGYNATTSTWVAFGCIDCTVPTEVTASASPNPICAGDTLTLTGDATDAIGWSWSGPNGFSSTSQSPTIASIITAGAGVYTLTASNTCGSAAPVNTDSVTINTNSTAATSASADPNSICNGGSSILSVTGGSLGTGASWHWYSGSCGGTAVGTGASVSVSPSDTTTYYVRAEGTCNTTSCVSVTVTVTPFSCGTCTVDDPDGNTYNTVLIGTQCWMAENLNYGTYVTLATGQGGAGTQKYCYDDNTANCDTYGGLYEWEEMMDGSTSCNGTGSSQPECSTPVQGICPAGWHVPSHYEWTLLEKNVGTNPTAFPYDESTIGWLGTDEGCNLKEDGTTHWTSPNECCSGSCNSSGFTALPGGNSWSGSFNNVGNYGSWWSASECDVTDAWDRTLTYSNAAVYRIDAGKSAGFGVRCVKD